MQLDFNRYSACHGYSDQTLGPTMGHIAVQIWVQLSHGIKNYGVDVTFNNMTLFIYLFICSLFNDDFSVNQTIQHRIKG
jgi:hypothetical protein